MQFVFTDFVVKELKNKGIIVAPKTIKLFENQGWMSSVYIAESNIGKLIIHSTNLVNEHKQNKVWDKFTGLVSIINSHKEISTSNFCFVGMQEEQLVLVQKFIDGMPCGKRKLDQEIITDHWSCNQTEIMEKVLLILANIHKIELKGFGWPLLSNSQLYGKYKNWQNFLEAESANWVKVIVQTDKKLGNRPIKNLNEIIERSVAQINYSGPAVLVHGDAINPGNILLKHDQAVALIDWEWSIAADPAWEFCYLGWWPFIHKNNLRSYFKAMGILSEQEIDDFLRRIKLYIPLWLLWGTCMHAEDTKSDVYQALRSLLIQQIANFLKKDKLKINGCRS